MFSRPKHDWRRNDGVLRAVPDIRAAAARSASSTASRICRRRQISNPASVSAIVPVIRSNKRVLSDAASSAIFRLAVAMGKSSLRAAPEKLPQSTVATQQRHGTESIHASSLIYFIPAILRAIEEDTRAEAFFKLQLPSARRHSRSDSHPSQAVSVRWKRRRRGATRRRSGGIHGKPCCGQRLLDLA